MPAFENLVYETYGTLNAAGDNCILVPTYYQGTAASYAPLIAPGRALDPTYWFIVVPNMLGNGLSSSPSNDPAFKNSTIQDNVHAQHKLLAHLGVKRIALLYGWSMGAMQGLAWASLYPDMVANLLPVCGTARCWPLNYVFLEGIKAAMRGGIAAFARAYAGWAYSAAFYHDSLYTKLGYATLEDFLRWWEADHETWAAEDLLACLWTWQNADLTLEQLGAIKARTIYMPCKQDMYFVLDEALTEAAAIPGCEVRIIDSPYGHCAGAPDLNAADTAMVEAAIRELLAG